MSTNTHARMPTKTRIEPSAGDRFVPNDAPAPMTPAKLIACHDVHGSADEGEVAVFAVAHQQGVFQNTQREEEDEAMCVLYLTADGEQACERWFRGADPEHFEDVDRAFIATESEVSPVGEMGKRFAPVVREHPEVGE